MVNNGRRRFLIDLVPSPCRDRNSSILEVNTPEVGLHSEFHLEAKFDLSCQPLTAVSHRSAGDRAMFVYKGRPKAETIVLTAASEVRPDPPHDSPDRELGFQFCQLLSHTIGLTVFRIDLQDAF